MMRAQRSESVTSDPSSRRRVVGAIGIAVAVSSVVGLGLAELLHRGNVAAGALDPHTHGHASLLLGIAFVGMPVVRLRDQVDLETLTAELRAVAGKTLEPSSASVLMVAEGGGR